MRERPILFSGPMVRAILEGRKTQTRRVCKPGERMLKIIDESPYGVPGDRLWVRENGWERPERSARDMREGADTWARYYYDADGEDVDWLREQKFRRRPSIHMPRWACRLVLELTVVRVERLQEISVSDTRAEGITLQGKRIVNQPSANTILREHYRELWNSLNAKRGFGWDVNPWVWVLEFRRV